MEETLMTFAGDSIKFMESITIFLGFVLLTEYNGKNIKSGFALQVLFLYLFQEIALTVSLYFTGSAQVSMTIGMAVTFAIGCVCYSGSVFRKIAAFAMYTSSHGRIDYLCSDAGN